MMSHLSVALVADSITMVKVMPSGMPGYIGHTSQSFSRSDGSISLTNRRTINHLQVCAARLYGS